MNVQGTKYVWAVRTKGYFGVVSIFANKPKLDERAYRGCEWIDGKKGTHWNPSAKWCFCVKDFNKIAKLPIGRPVKLTIKVTLR